MPSFECEGLHRSEKSGREWLPFTVRLYFYSGQSAVRLVHSIVFDGDQEKDFVRGLGVEFSVPYREDARYRQVRFGGQEGGLWSEPLQPGGGNSAQEAGQSFTPRGNFSDNARSGMTSSWSNPTPTGSPWSSAPTRRAPGFFPPLEPGRKATSSRATGAAAWE